MPSHKIFNERPECQDRLISFLQKMGYTYVSRSEAEQKRGSLSKVIFTDELIRFLSKQTYKYKGYEFLFSGDSVQRAVNALDASLLQGLSMASKEIYNLLTLGISLEENVILDKDVPVRQSFDLSYIDFEHPANNIWQVTEEFSVERPNGQYARPDVVLMVNGIPIVVIECKKSSVDVKEGVLHINICRRLCTVVSVCDVEVWNCRKHFGNLCNLGFIINTIELVKVSAF